MKSAKGITWIAVLFAGALLLGEVMTGRPAQLPVDQPENDSRIQQGFAIAPVPLNLENKNLALVGLGSYLVNAVASCNACHTCPSYKPSHSPFQGGDGQINAARYLAGGLPFPPSPFVSSNITPDASGNPAGLTFDQFRILIRTGVAPEHQTRLLQIMPWPTFRKMDDHDLQAIYEYLSSIPHADTPPAGSCAVPDQ